MTVVTASEAPAARSARALLTDRTFGVYFVANLTSNCGTWLQNIAMAVVVYRITRSTVMVGAVSMLQFAASLLLSPWFGALGDRIDRRLLLLTGSITAAVPATVLAIWTALVGVEGLPGPWPVFASAALIGVGWAISVPNMQALVPALVGEADLDQAIALNSVTFNLARAVGPALGALTLDVLGAAAAFGLNAATYLVLITALAIIRPRPTDRRRPAGHDGSVRAGLRYVRSEPALFVLLIGVTALGFGTDPVNTLAPAMADALGGGDALVGWLVSAFGLGAAAMALSVGAVRRRVSLGPLGVFGLAVLALGLFGFGSSPAVPLTLASLVLAGVGFLLALTALTTELQRRVPDRLLGRVMALWAVAFLGSRPLAALVDGAVADALSPRTAAVLAGVVTLAAAVWLRWARRHYGLDADAALGSPAAEPELAEPPVSG